MYYHFYFSDVKKQLVNEIFKAHTARRLKVGSSSKIHIPKAMLYLHVANLSFSLEEHFCVSYLFLGNKTHKTWWLKTTITPLALDTVGWQIWSGLSSIVLLLVLARLTHV